MDNRLVAWGRAVKARQRRHRSSTPPLWLFTDPARMPDLLAVVGGLPAGLCGVVFRHDGVPGRAALLRQVARLCRARRLRLVVAGGGELPPGAGRHLRDGWGRIPPGRLSTGRLSTSSAHGRAALVRARRAGVAAAFLSPAFVTGSHPGAAPLGPLRWGLTAGGGGFSAAALGGVNGHSVRRLPDFVEVIGAIDALLP